jgi:hypothetical protein
MLRCGMAKPPKKPKPKPKDLQMAEFVYEFAYDDFMSKINGRGDREILDEETLIRTRAAVALEQWKKDGGRTGRPDMKIRKAREAWEAAGKPVEGIWYKEEFFRFTPDGVFDLSKSRMYAGLERV